MVDIVLATYNGERYLDDLLQSLEMQSYKDWRLFVGDDRSTDSTVSILERFAETSDHYVDIMVNEKSTGSAKANFLSLLSKSSGEYIMLCDQDDIWLDEKIEKTINKMHELEMKHGSELPLLVNTDLCVVDESLNIIDNSFFHYSLYDHNFSIQKQLAYNKVTGCTVMINKALCSYLKDIPFDYSKITMHDSWLMLIALCFGHTGFVSDSLILYRQTGNNSVGAHDVRRFSYQLKKIIDVKALKNSNLSHINEAEYFCETYRRQLKGTHYESLINGYAALKKHGALYYRYYCLKHGIIKYPLNRAFAQLWFTIS